MPKICYVPHNFKKKSQLLLDKCNNIIEEYMAQGYMLTLRQLYYQLVSRDIIPNKLQSYKTLGTLLNDARLAGLVDWESIQDLTRDLRGLSHWPNPESIIQSAAASFRLDKWLGQPNYVEVWVEKDALRNVIERVANEWDVSYFACRGYVSVSEMWVAAERFKRYENNGRRVTILHLGDHDPSGLDMTRDIQTRLNIFGLPQIRVKRIALNMDQVEKYNPPPNPAKETDSRFLRYMEEFGDESWELDALNPKVLHDLIDKEITKLCNVGQWASMQRSEAKDQRLLEACKDNWGDVVNLLQKKGKGK